MRIAITGAAGRLGRHVVARALLAGHEVVAVDLPAVVGSQQSGTGVVWRGADLTVADEARAALAGADAVVHLGGLPDPLHHPAEQVHRTNVEAGFNVLLAAEEHGIGAVCLASSVNAIGGAFSSDPRYDWFPVDEDHPSYCEDVYSLSKWVLEQQSAAFARRRPAVPFSCLRFHALCADAAAAAGLRGPDPSARRRDLWGWTSFDAASGACLLAVQRRSPGHAAYHVVADRTASAVPSAELAQRFYPGVPIRSPLPGTASFYTSARAVAELGWDPADDHPAVSDAERGVVA